jgi:hypothetical protein
MYVSLSMLMDCTLPDLTRPMASEAQKNMCHIVKAIGYGNPPYANKYLLYLRIIGSSEGAEAILLVREMAVGDGKCKQGQLPKKVHVPSRKLVSVGNKLT